MNKWLLIFLAGFVAPFIIVYMWVRHPIRCWRELVASFKFCILGKDDDKGLY